MSTLQQKPRLLFITHKMVSIDQGGDLERMRQMLDLLAERYAIDVVCLDHHHPEAAKDGSPGLPSIESERVFYVPKWRRVLHAARTLINRKPLLLNHFMHAPMRRHVARIADGYDLVWCGSVAAAQYLPKHLRSRAVWDITDSLTKNIDNEAAKAGGLKRLRLKWEACRMRRYERRTRAAMGRTLYISDSDSRYVAPPGSNIFVVPNFVEEGPSIAAHLPQARSLLFVGRMDYAPNVLAVKEFCRVAWPKVKAAIPQVSLIIAGKNPTAEVKALGVKDGVLVTGYVESLDPFWRDCAVVVAPMLSGSGVQNKILQAMSHGCCVVTTPLGADGLPEGLVPVCDDLERMADDLIDLLPDADRRRQHGREAYRAISADFSRSAARDALTRALPHP